uniref:F-box associated domain-containing protein n=1 Tax=Leersia perrieri TaxID=77586 RepID=A0A0D9VEA3_9ORYZ
MDPPDRIPLQLDLEINSSILGCRDGLVLILNPTRRRFLVWDPVSGEHRRVAVPPECDGNEMRVRQAAVVRAGAGEFHFQIVFLGVDGKDTRAFGCVYSSETSKWGKIISTPLPLFCWECCHMKIPGVLIGDCLYWSLRGYQPPIAIIEFDLDKQRT